MGVAGGFVNLFVDVLDGVVDVALGLFDVLLGFFDSLPGVLRGLVGGVAGITSRFMGGIANITGGIASGVADFVAYLLPVSVRAAGQRDDESNKKNAEVHGFFPMQYKWPAVRRKRLPPETATELRVYSPVSFSARSSNWGPARNTLVTPSSLDT